MSDYDLSIKDRHAMLATWRADLRSQRFQAQVNYLLAVDRNDAAGQKQAYDTIVEMERSLDTLETLTKDLPRLATYQEDARAKPVVTRTEPIADPGTTTPGPRN